MAFPFSAAWSVAQEQRDGCQLADSATAELGRCRPDPAAHLLFRADVELALTPKGYRLLEHIVTSAGRRPGLSG